MELLPRNCLLFFVVGLNHFLGSISNVYFPLFLHLKAQLTITNSLVILIRNYSFVFKNLKKY